MTREGIDVSMVKANPRASRGKFQRCVEAVSARGGAYDPRAVCAVQERRAIGQRELTRRAVAGKRRAQRAHNPADAASEAYQIFHGEPPSRFTEVVERRHHHGFLFSVGRLEYLIVRTIDRSSEVKLKKFAGAFLAGNEQAFKELSETGHARAQLYIKDGDQSINLEDFGIDPQRAHEIETLGRVIDVGYETNKVHLGAEGGQAIYDHKFRRTREGDVEITVDWARYPDLIYYVLDERLEFSGGSYELIAEGINL
jgi:hypothetical protein